MSGRIAASLALAAFLGAQASLAAQSNSDGSFQSGERYMERDGEAVFKNVCAACHMADGKGASGAARYPSLSSNTKLATIAIPYPWSRTGRAPCRLSREP